MQPTQSLEDIVRLTLGDQAMRLCALIAENARLKAELDELKNGQPEVTKPKLVKKDA